MKDNGSICKMTVDGTDCRINEPTPFEKKWYSHKFKGPGLRYEVGVCIQTGYICWVNGPFPCGTWTDLKIARSLLVHKIGLDEMCLADGGYRDGYTNFETPTGLNNYDQRMKKLARARHETINSRLKYFKVLSGTFHHELEKHGTCFMAVANITQLNIMHGMVPFQVEYNDLSSHSM
jgi:hypothetical protein